MIKTLTIKIPVNIEILINNNFLVLKNTKFQSFIPLLNNFFIYQKKNILFLTSKDLKKNTLQFLNLYHKLILNKIFGLQNGFFSQLECKGLGYKAKVKNNLLILKIGFSHKIEVKIPNKIKIFCSKANNIVLFSKDKQFLYQFLYNIRNYRKPDHYKGKGLKLKKEILKLKEGKKI
jgi:large subunit ribosomal protein L6